MTDTERIAELERRVRELETTPREIHHHYHPPVYVQPYVPLVPPQPYPWIEPWAPPSITWGDSSGTPNTTITGCTFSDNTYNLH